MEGMKALVIMLSVATGLGLVGTGVMRFLKYIYEEGRKAGSENRP